MKISVNIKRNFIIPKTGGISNGNLKVIANKNQLIIPKTHLYIAVQVSRSTNSRHINRSGRELSAFVVGWLSGLSSLGGFRGFRCWVALGAFVVVVVALGFRRRGVAFGFCCGVACGGFRRLGGFRRRGGFRLSMLWWLL